jgi:hypothetical protein
MAGFVVPAGDRGKLATVSRQNRRSLGKLLDQEADARGPYPRRASRMPQVASRSQDGQISSCLLIARQARRQAGRGSLHAGAASAAAWPMAPVSMVYVVPPRWTVRGVGILSSGQDGKSALRSRITVWWLTLQCRAISRSLQLFQQRCPSAHLWSLFAQPGAIS